MDNLKRIVLVVGVVLLLMSILVVGCAKPAPAPAPAPVPAPAPAPTPAPAAVEPIKWMWMNMSNSWDARALPQLVEAIETGTGGRLQIDIFLPGEHPYKLGDMLNAVKLGETDVGQVYGGYATAIEPRLGVLDIPFMTPGDIEAYVELYNSFAEGFFDDVWAEWNTTQIIPLFMGAQQFYLKEGWIENWDSLKGKRIRSWSTDVGNMISLLNGTPVQISWGDVYTSLQTGLIDGMVTSFDAAYSNGMLEICKNVVIASTQYVTAPYLVNQDSLAALPADVRDDLLRTIEANTDWYSLGLIRQDGVSLMSAFLTEQIQARPIPTALRQEILNKAYDNIWKPWIERAGPEGADAFNQVAKVLIASGREVPGYTPY